MATIENLTTSITKLSFDEAVELVKALRLNRTIPKKKPKKPRASSKATKSKKKLTTKDIINSLSKEDKLKLLAQLKGE